MRHRLAPVRPATLITRWAPGGRGGLRGASVAAETGRTPSRAEGESGQNSAGHGPDPAHPLRESVQHPDPHVCAKIYSHKNLQQLRCCLGSKGRNTADTYSDRISCRTPTATQRDTPKQPRENTGRISLRTSSQDAELHECRQSKVYSVCSCLQEIC